MSIRSAAKVLLAFGLLVPLAWACGGGGGSRTPTQPPPPPPPPTGEVSVSVEDFAFAPKTVAVEPGQTVAWRLEGSDRNHTVTAVDGSFNSGAVFTSNGATFRRTFTEADRDKTFEYRCAAHQACCAMQGSVRVGANAPPPDTGY